MAKKRKGPTKKRPAAVQLLLLTGVPGTGKTTMGEYLQAHHRFRHLNFEHPNTLQHYLAKDQGHLRREVESLRADGRDVVITWGFVPDVQLGHVLFLRTLGFTWVWLDGDREAAHQAFTERGDVSEADWQRQLDKIGTFIDPQLAVLSPVTVNPFDDEGRFRPSEEVAMELLSPGRGEPKDAERV